MNLTAWQQKAVDRFPGLSHSFEGGSFLLHRSGGLIVTLEYLLPQHWLATTSLRFYASGRLGDMEAEALSATPEHAVELVLERLGVIIPEYRT